MSACARRPVGCIFAPLPRADRCPAPRIMPIFELHRLYRRRRLHRAGRYQRWPRRHHRQPRRHLRHARSHQRQGRHDRRRSRPPGRSTTGAREQRGVPVEPAGAKGSGPSGKGLRAKGSGVPSTHSVRRPLCSLGRLPHSLGRLLRRLDVRTVQERVSQQKGCGEQHACVCRQLLVVIVERPDEGERTCLAGRRQALHRTARATVHATILSGGDRGAQRRLQLLVVLLLVQHARGLRRHDALEARR
eukprot:gene3415-biopygen9992